MQDLDSPNPPELSNTIEIPKIENMVSSYPPMNAAIPLANLADRIAYMHASLYSLSLSTMCDAIDAG